MAAQPYGLIATYETPAELYHAAEKVRDAGYKNWDCITPAPIHGLDTAMGVKRSIVPRFSLTGGLTGFCTGMSMIWYMNAFDYALRVGGKPMFSPQFAFPVSYELTILFTAFATIGGMFFLNGLTKLYHPVLNYEHIRRGTDDQFFIVIETADPRFHAANTRALLEESGGRQIAELEAEAMRRVYLITAFVVVLFVSVLGFRGTPFGHPPMDVFPDKFFPGMKQQPKYRPQGSSEFFSDGRADRLPPPGVVPASQPLRSNDALYLGKKADGSWVRGYPAPLAVSAKFLARGRERYDIYCLPCHGSLGDGNGVTKRYGMGATPSYHDDRLRQMSEGEIFDIISHGKAPAFNMSPYADKLTPEDRWAVIAYVRALQRAQKGTLADVPADHRSELGIK